MFVMVHAEYATNDFKFLGVSKMKLSRLLKHLVYDGVYADANERVAGGGSLELKKYVIQLLGLNENSLTGN